ncbi:MFS transporter [Comamonadaceae bacterium G21597-S1]|nr:MFS transporter [Comamonadaceae bacterium G21597-S1]
MKIFYGWRMAGAAGILQFLQSALLMQSFGAYVAVLSDERGWSKTALSGAAALQSVETAILGPALGWLLDRFGPRAMLQVGMLVFGSGFLLLSQIETLAGFYASAVMMAVGVSLGGYFPLTVSLIQWFERYRARALSVMSMGLALGGVAVPAVAWSMATYGWRATAFGSGVIIIVLGLPLSRVIRWRPQDQGDTVDGLPEAPAQTVGSMGSAPASRAEFSVRQALRTRAFWLLALGHGFALLVVTAVNVHAITHMKEGLGYTVTQAAFFIMILTFGQVGGVVLSATIGDRFEKRLLAAVCMLGHMVGLLLLTYATHPAQVAAFAVLHGMAWGLRGPLMQSIRADYFGRNAIGMILGLSAVIIALGQIAGPMVAGMLADLTGNYRAGFTVLALTAGCGSLLFVFAIRPQRPVAH